MACREQHPVNHPEYDYPGCDILAFRGPSTRLKGGGLAARNAVVMCARMTGAGATIRDREVGGLAAQNAVVVCAPMATVRARDGGWVSRLEMPWSCTRRLGAFQMHLIISVQKITL